MSIFDKIMATNIVVALVFAVIISIFENDTPSFIAYSSMISFALIPILLIVRIWM